jgi:hypothetical protein
LLDASDAGVFWLMAPEPTGVRGTGILAPLLSLEVEMIRILKHVTHVIFKWTPGRV